MARLASDRPNGGGPTGTVSQDTAVSAQREIPSTISTLSLGSATPGERQRLEIALRDLISRMERVRDRPIGAPGSADPGQLNAQAAIAEQIRRRPDTHHDI